MTTGDQVLSFLLARRSASDVEDPAPSDAQLETILQVAATVPDHGALRPYRFVVVRGAGRDRFGDGLAAAAAEARPDVPADAFSKVKKKAFKAPLLIVLIASPQDDGKIERWEQQATAACTGFAMVLAATALGLGAVWKSSPYVNGRLLTEVLGLTRGEQVLGWINLGKKNGDDGTRKPIDVGAVASVLDGGPRRPFRTS